MGDHGVGKSTLAKHLVPKIDWETSSFRPRMSGLEALNHIIPFQIWDMEVGINIDFPEQFYQNSNAVIIVFEVNNRSSFDNLSYWIERAKSINPIHPPVTLIVGNKTDIQGDRILENEVMKFIEIYEKEIPIIDYYEVSLKKNINLNLLLASLIPETLGFEKKCFNCFKLKNKILLIDNFYYCKSCYLKGIDSQKARAFFRVVYD